MINRNKHGIAPFASSLLSSNIVGTWDHDVTADRVVLDAGAAAVMTGDRDYGGQQIPLSLAFNCLHDQDRPWVFPKLDAVSQGGGDFIADYLVNTKTGIRRLLDYGHLSKSSNGAVQGYGILLDINNIDTDNRHPKVSFEIARQKDLLQSLSGLQVDLGQKSVRAAILIDMLRAEVARLDTGL
ncbi:hypothetical protein [Methylorubrum thiocyanatum]|uniref:Uncharacterized protein n=1 Tax=Methylorubrum thiocyanatum TaxID=47958 RepID=A0AA40S7X8_9HYPH|nr:hypothetical protein [Methylorubrum thiocyanatum]MBA8916100.1 hypothetical protein [Methylorubrum thiocyanatum]